MTTLLQFIESAHH